MLYTAHEPVVERFLRLMALGFVTPSTNLLQRMHDAALHPAIVRAFNAM